MRILINGDYGGFYVSDEVAAEYKQLTGRELNVYTGLPQYRDDVVLITLYDKYGDKFGDKYATIGTVEIPEAATDWNLMEYDGIEWVEFVLDGELYAAHLNETCKAGHKYAITLD